MKGPYSSWPCSTAVAILVSLPPSCVNENESAQRDATIKLFNPSSNV